MQAARKKMRQIMVKIRGGTAELRVETSRGIGLKREDRIYGQGKWRMSSNLC